MAACLAAPGAAVLAQTSPPHSTKIHDPAEARRQLDASRHQLEEAQRRTKELQGDVALLHEDREKLNKQLLDTAQSVQASEAQLSQSEARLGELGEQEGMIRGSLEKSYGSISSLLAAMQRMGRNPPPVVVTRREDAVSMVRSAMLLAKVFPELRGQALRLSGQLDDLVRVIDEGRSETERLRIENARISETRQQLKTLVETRKRMLAERSEELVQVRKAAADIAKNVTDLNDLVAKLEKLDKPAAQPGVDGAAPEGQQVASAPSNAIKPAPTKPAEDLRPSITLQPGERMAMASPGRLQPAIPFEQAKGTLPMPAQGRIIRGFGDHAQTGHSDGLVLETRHGAQVISPNDGWIMYAGEFRSYGQILIINAGGGYHVLLAGLSQIDVQVGQSVLAGEPVGVMIASAKTASAKPQDSAPVLYVEFRKNQRPLDPGPWWAETARKVAG